MRPSPDTRKPPGSHAAGGLQNQGPSKHWITTKDTPVRKDSCHCGWNWCPYRLREQHELLTRPDVHHWPSSWETMLLCGYDPLTGERAA